MWSKSFELKYGGVTLFFGPGVLRERINYALESIQRALVITSRSAAMVSGALDDVLNALKSKDIEYMMYSNVTSNPSSRYITEIIEIAVSFKPDALIAIGGGSVIDVAKTTSAVYETGITVLDYINNPRPISSSRLRLIVVNLTHGTGSEVNQYAVLTKEGTIEKVGFPTRYPDVSFDDPIYTLTLDRNQSFYTSIDAFYHAYESSTSRRSNLLVVDLAERAVLNIVKYLGRVLKEPRDLESRAMLMYSSLLSGICIDTTRGTHLAHAIEHGISGFNPEIPHGAGLAMVGPLVVEYTHKAVPEISALILRHLNPEIKPIREDALKARRAVEELNRVAGFDKRLSDYGISESDIAHIARFVEKTVAARYGYNTPFEVNYNLIYNILRMLL